MQSAAAYAVEVDLPRLGRLPGRSRGVQSAGAYAVEVALPCLLRREGTLTGSATGYRAAVALPVRVPSRPSEPGRATSIAYIAADCTSRERPSNLPKRGMWSLLGVTFVDVLMSVLVLVAR